MLAGLLLNQPVARRPYGRFPTLRRPRAAATDDQILAELKTNAAEIGIKRKRSDKDADAALLVIFGMME